MAGKKISQLPSGSLANLPLNGLTPVVHSGVTYQHSLSQLRQILVDSGSHHFTGSQNINGNIWVTENSNFGNSLNDTHRFTGSILVTGSVNINDIISTEKLYVTGFTVIGTRTTDLGNNYTPLHVGSSGSINITHFEGNNQHYTQINVKNTNSSNNASSDIVATADNGSETNHYVNLGINSSTYDGGFVGYENDAYLLNVGKDLYVGTVGGTSHPAKLKLFAQNQWVDPQMTIHTGSQITFNTNTFTEGYTYEFSGSLNLHNELNVNGSVTASYFIGDGSQLTNLPVQSTDVSIFLSSSTFASASASFDSRITSATNEQDLSYFATTGSNSFYGSQIVTGSIIFEGGGSIIPNFNATSGNIDLKAGNSSGWAEIISHNEQNFIYVDDNGAYVATNWNSGGQLWTFDRSGSLSGSIITSSFYGDGSGLTNLPTPTLISSGPTAPGTAVVANDTDVDINFSGVGTKFSFTQTGMTFPDSTIQTTAFTGIPTNLATTGSNTFVGNQTITGSITVTEGFTGSLDYSHLMNVPSLISGSSQINYSGLTGIPNGIISGSGQLPSGLISGSLQISDFGFLTTSSFNSYTTSQYGLHVAHNDGINFLYNTKLNTSSFNEFTTSVATTGSNTFVGNQTINGSLIIEGVSEILTVDGGFSGNRSFDYTSGSIFYLTGLTGNGTWNINNVPTTNNRGLTMTFVIEQGVTAFSGSAYSFDSTPVTVKWVDSTVPTGSANKTEVIGLTAFRVGSSWNVLGSLSTFGS